MFALDFFWHFVFLHQSFVLFFKILSSEDQINISCKSSPICSLSMQKKQTTTSGVKGSSWIESVINKIEEVDSAKPCSSLMTLTNYDSAKKKKFKPLV